MQLKFVTLILALLVHIAACQIPHNPWPPGTFYCLPTHQYRLAGCQNGLRWCTNGCFFWVCGWCIKLPIPVRTKYIPWPPGPPPPGPGPLIDPGVVIHTDYQNMTETDMKTWLTERGIKTQIEGREKLFEFAAGELSSIACKVGVTDGVKSA